jgi:uncharacterized protein (DUF1778 family)
MGRKKMTAEKIDIRLRMDAKLQKQIQAAADKEFTTVAAFIRAAVVKELKRREAEAKGAK